MADYRLFGPVEVRARGRLIDAGQPRQRLVLAILLVDAGQLVTSDVLADRMWGDSPPREARGAMRAHIARVRRVLERASAADGDRASLVHRSGGYILDVDRERIDLHRFRRMVNRCRETTCAPGTRIALLREAVGLWRGQPLAGLAGDWAARMRHTWVQQYLDAVVAWGRAELGAGNSAGVVSLVQELSGEHPLVEPLAAVLIRALCAAGRQAEALDHYAQVRSRLADELGVDPGTELLGLHKAILRGEPALSAPSIVQITATPRSVPAQLPADVAFFTGRQDELGRLNAAISPQPAAGSGERRATVILAISGTAGVGKTALAVHWAHRVCDQFPDGQMYVNLRGHDQGRPVAPTDALEFILTALGVQDRDIPAGVDHRVARYRTETANRRMLILLDNVGRAEQVRPLLPGGPGCVVLVTSRDSLPGLVAVHGARRLDLDLMPIAEAVTLLRRLIGRRVDTEPDAAAELAGECARLPLALRVAAELAARRPERTIKDLVTDLADEQVRLELLGAGDDPYSTVTAVFSWSIKHMPATAAHTFRLLGLHPGPDIDVYAIAALAQTSVEQAQRDLDVLTRAHLVRPVARGRYDTHDLLRAYAAQLTTRHPRPDNRHALDRLYDYYLGVAAIAMASLYPGEATRRPRVPTPITPTPALANAEDARTWLDAERPCLVAAAHATAHGWPGHTVKLSGILYRYLVGGYAAEALAIHAHAYRAARQVGDRVGKANALNGLGSAHWQLGRYKQAMHHYRRALAEHQRAGDATGEARILNNLAAVDQRLGHHELAAEYNRHALAIYRKHGDTIGEARTLNNLGTVLWYLGRYDLAVDHHRQALDRFSEAGNCDGEAHALNNLAEAEEQLDRLDAAAEHNLRALVLFRHLGNRLGEACALDTRGTIHTRLGQFEEGAEHYRQALARFREIGDRDGEARALNGLGEAALANGRPAEALAHHRAACAVAALTRGPDQQTRAHLGITRADDALNKAHPRLPALPADSSPELLE